MRFFEYFEDDFSLTDLERNLTQKFCSPTKKSEDVSDRRHLFEGEWKIASSKNTSQYYQAIGVSSWLVPIVSRLTADIEIKIKEEGVEQISRTNGLIQKTVEQFFPVNENSVFYNPLTGKNELLSVETFTKKLQLRMDHENSPISEVAEYTISSDGKFLQICRKTMPKNISATWNFEKKVE